MSQKWFNNIDLQQNELQNGVIQNLAGNPSNGKAGQIYYNTVDKGYRYYNGSAWVSITAEAAKFIKAGNGLTSTGTDTVTISLGNPSASALVRTLTAPTVLQQIVILTKSNYPMLRLQQRA